MARKAPKFARALGADAPVLEGFAEYRRKDETEIIIPERAIVTELTSKGGVKEPKLNARRAYFVDWVVPDPSNQRGALLEVEQFRVNLRNEGAYDLNVIAQQPHGHEAAPSSVAAWVLLANRTVKAGASLALRVTPVDNAFVVPLRADVGGLDVMVAVAFSIARQGMPVGGSATAPTGDEVGIRMSVEAHYKSSGNSLESGQFFSLRTFSNDRHLAVVDPKPPVPVAVGDIALNSYRLGWGSFVSGGVEYFTPSVYARGGSTIPAAEWTGLSQQHVYRLPVSVKGILADKTPREGLYIKFHVPDGAPGYWYVVRTPDDGVDGALIKATTTYGILPENSAELSADAQLYPLRPNSFQTVKCRQRGGAIVYTPVLGKKGEGEGNFVSCRIRADPPPKFLAQLMSAVSFIVSVIKVASAAAGAVGLLANVAEVEEEFVVVED